MIYNYPYFGFPSYMQHMGSPPPPKSIPRKNTPNSEYGVKPKLSSNHFIPKAQNNLASSKSEQKPFFNLFGINLYFDDILLICLIFFLYNEKIDDNYLLLALVLLLLS